MGRSEKRSLELNIVLDERKIACADAELKALQSSIDDLESSELSLAQVNKRLGTSFDSLDNNDVVKGLRAQARALEENIDAMSAYIRKANEAAKADDGIGRGGLLSERNAQAQGDISTSLGGAASIISNIPGLGGAGIGSSRTRGYFGICGVSPPPE